MKLKKCKQTAEDLTSSKIAKKSSIEFIEFRSTDFLKNKFLITCESAAN